MNLWKWTVVAAASITVCTALLWKWFFRELPELEYRRVSRYGQSWNDFEIVFFLIALILAIFSLIEVRELWIMRRRARERGAENSD